MGQRLGYRFILILIFLGLQGFWLPCRDGVNCLKLTSEPQNINVNLNQTVVLNCEFDVPVDECQWRRSDWPIVLGGRYTFFSGDGMNSKACSLKISNIGHIDFGTWMCVGKLNNGTSSNSNSISITNSKFVGIRGNQNVLLVDTVYISDDETLQISCSQDGVNQEQFTYLWEQRSIGNDTWTSYSSEKTIMLSAEKVGYFRCSVIEGNFRYYSLEYFIAKSEIKEDKDKGITTQDIFLLLAGIAIGSILMVAVAVAIIFYTKSNYKITFYRKQLAYSKKHQHQQNDIEMKPLLNETDEIIINTKQIDVISQGGTSYDWKIKNYEAKKLEEAAGKTPYLSSEDFRVEGTEYYFRAKLYLNGFGDYNRSFMSILLEVVNYDPRTLSHFYHKRKILLLDQSGFGGPMCWEHEPTFMSEESQTWMRGPWGPVDFFPIPTRRDERTFLKKGAIKFRIIIEPLLTLTKHLTLENNGPGFIWKIDNYLQRAQYEYDNLNRCLESEPFYCYPEGYRVKCLVYFHGCGKGRHSHISIFYGFLNGRYDHNLPPVFPHRATLRILDQKALNKGRHIEKTYTLNCDEPPSAEDKDRMSEFHGFLTFAERIKVNKEPYLVNDTIIIQVIINPLDKKGESRRSKSQLSIESQILEKMEPLPTIGTDMVINIDNH